MDDHHDEVRFETVRSGGVSRAVPILTFLVGIFLGAALVKPWDLFFPPPAATIDRQQTPTAAARATPAPSSSATASGPPAECAFAGGWRVFALGQRDRLGGDGSTGGATPSAPSNPFADIGNPLRRWLEVAPVSEASGAADAAIPFVTIVSDRITGIGYCPPPNGVDGPPTGSQLEAWALDDGGGATELPLRPIAVDAAMPLELEVFIGADGEATSAGRWAPGRYVFAVADPDGGYGRWFGVEIRTPPGRPSG